MHCSRLNSRITKLSILISFYHAGRTLAAFAVFLLAIVSNVQGHHPSDSYLNLEISADKLEGQWDIALRDLEFTIGLDSDIDGEVTWGELESKRNAVEKYAYAHLRFYVDQVAVPVRGTDLLVADHSDGVYAVLRFTLPLPPKAMEMRVDYSLLFATDVRHRGFYQVLQNGTTQNGVLSPTENYYRCALNNGEMPDSTDQGFKAFFREGIWHIWMGYDHLLFLLALLLPSVLRRRNGKWVPIPTLRSATLGVVKVITAFTLAHSLTLSLAALGWVHLSSRFVESTIAASVIVAACNNIRPVFLDRGWVVAFIFGLIHGFGFASVLVDLGLQTGSLATALIGFNVGVEAGQLAIVAVFLPLAYALRRSWIYQGLILKSGSVGIAGIAAVWMCERVLNFKVLPF